jgi:hypothetical protein
MQAEMGASLLLTMREAAEIIGVDFRRIRNWVRDDIIRPEVRAPMGGGRGCTHLFTVSQVYGLAIATWLWVEPYSQVRRRYFMEDYRRFAAMDWSAIEHALGLRDDWYSEEVFVKELWQWRGQRPTSDGPTVDDVLADPEQYARIVRLAKRLMALRSLVLEKMLMRRMRGMRTERVRYYGR